MRTMRIALGGWIVLAFAGGAWAQDDPLADDFAAPVEDEALAAAGQWYGDLLLRADTVRGLERPEDLERFKGRGRLGWRFTGDRFEAGVAVEAALGTDDNRDNRANLDNERSDDLGLDEAFVRVRLGEQGALLLGKTAFPLELTPLTWDPDLRPVGVSFAGSLALGAFDRLSATAGWFAGDHLYGDDSQIAAAQFGWHWREGAPLSGSLLLGFLDFDDLDALARQGLARTNRNAGGRLRSGFRLLDVQLGLRADVDGRPLDVRLDVVRNLDAFDDDEDEGARLSLVLGSRREPGGWEFGYAVQRIQSDAVVAAFNADDWWFHSRSRGSMPWLGYGFDATWSLRVAAFFERRDDQPDGIERLLVDLEARW